MLKHFYSSPTIRKNRSKSQSSDTESIDDVRHYHHHSLSQQQYCLHQSDDDFITKSNKKLSSSICMSARCRRCPTNLKNNKIDSTGNIIDASSPVVSSAAAAAAAAVAAENSVRRWNSFHSTRGECHPNKFRRDRKSTSPSIDLSGQRNIIVGSPVRKYSYGSSCCSSSGGVIGGGGAELRRGNSLAEKSTTSTTSLLASPSSSISSAHGGGDSELTYW